MPTVRAMAVQSAKSEFKPFEFTLPELGDEQVDVAVEYCGVCHSDLSMMKNDWGMAAYPLVPGHEVVGRVKAVGRDAKGVKVGDRVGLGWYSASCMTCDQCMSGNHNLCPGAESTIIGRHGGFATIVRSHWGWLTHLPEALDPATSGPLFCGGITVFNPIIQFGVLPTHRVGVIGIGGLGHLALQFLSKWGCEVTAFSSSAGKSDELRKLGAHNVVSSRDAAAMKPLVGKLDFILSTVNADLDWSSYITALAPKGRLHTVGAVLSPIPVSAFSLISGQKSVSGSPLGSPFTTRTMIDFCARHKIAPVTESFPMSKVNEAFAHLESGKARYRVVLKNDLN